eukprot:Skav231322  [mRNA]  locus=scaffold819:3266:10124:- [translate_table: standard]
MGCPGSWHGSYHLHTHVFEAGVGHAEGRIYDCDAGFSNWMQGWSDSKKDWCCSKHNRGCVKFHCNSDAVPWLHLTSTKRLCCSNFQKGCPHTTLSALKCDAVCDHAGTPQVTLVVLVEPQEEAFTLQAGTPRREAASIPEAASTPQVAAMRPTMSSTTIIKQPSAAQLDSTGQ